MVKLLWGTALLIIIAILFIYISIPGKIIFSKVTYLKSSKNSAHRFLSEENNWKKWWPADLKNNASAISQSKYYFKNYSYTITGRSDISVNIQISKGSDSVNSLLQIIPLLSDSIALKWNGFFHASNNPIKKIENYIAAKRMKNNMAEIIQSAKSFLINDKNVYGLNIKKESVKDTFLISTKITSDNFPSTETIYSLIHKLQKYVLLNNAVETNSPMLNVTEDNGIYKTMVAIPINKEIAQNDNFVFKKMVPGKILISEVTGGVFTARESLSKMSLYMEDYRLTSPAIPYESLITNRMEEPDTSKWVTKIYYPVF